MVQEDDLVVSLLLSVRCAKIEGKKTLTTTSLSMFRNHCFAY